MAKIQNFKEITIEVDNKKKTFEAPVTKIADAYMLGMGSGHFLLSMIPYLSDNLLKDIGDYKPSDPERVKNGKKLKFLIGLLESSYEMNMMEMNGENMEEESWLNNEDFLEADEQENSGEWEAM